MVQETVTLQTPVTARNAFGNMSYQDTNMHFYRYNSKYCDTAVYDGIWCVFLPEPSCH
jgi:hypothetical protein